MTYDGQEYVLLPSEILYLRGGEPSDAQPCDCYYKDNGLLIMCDYCKITHDKDEEDDNEDWKDMLTDIGGEA